jgi:dTDP-4-amino-4,6-dideoxygalactose transaminase
MLAGGELEYIREAVATMHLSGDGDFTRRCHTYLRQLLGARRALQTTSCDALIINDNTMSERAEILREKGTNRSRFFRGEVGRWTNRVCELIMDCERQMVTRGLGLPWGSSLLAVARRPQDSAL